MATGTKGSAGSLASSHAARPYGAALMFRFLAAALVALLVASSAHAELVYRGDPQFAAQAAALYARFPATARAIPLYVETFTREESRKLAPFHRRGYVSTRYLGPVDPKNPHATPKIAVVHVRAGRKALRWVLPHEAAHVFWSEVLTEAQRADWLAYHARHPDRMPRPYSRQTAEEGFADEFARVYTGAPIRGADRPLHPETAAKVRAYFGERAPAGRGAGRGKRRAACLSYETFPRRRMR